MNRIAVGAVAGLVLALVVSFSLTGGAGRVLVPALLNAVAGAAVGLVAERSGSRALTLLSGVVLGLLAWWFVGRGSGSGNTALLVGALVGLSIGAIVSFRGRPTRRGTTEP